MLSSTNMATLSTWRSCTRSSTSWTLHPDGREIDGILRRSADRKFVSGINLSAIEYHQVLDQQSLILLPTTTTTMRITMDRGYVTNDTGCPKAEQSFSSVRNCHLLAFTGGITLLFHSIMSRKHPVTASHTILSQVQSLSQSLMLSRFIRAGCTTVLLKMASTSMTIPLVNHFPTV